jgi:hypothetical protein
MIARAFFFLFVGMGAFPVLAQAQPITHPLWAPTPNATWDAPARVQLEVALKTRGLGPLERLESPKQEDLRDIEAPDAAPSSYDPAAHDKEAANRAKVKGAGFALLGRLHPDNQPEVSLRLIDAQTGELMDNTAVDLVADTSSADLIAAVMRLDEIASRTSLTRKAINSGNRKDAPLSLVVPPPRAATDDSPKLSSDAEGWFWHHWPLVTAIGTAIGTALVLGIVVARDDH